MIYYETDYLAHHGVKGMKWGVRKDRYQKKTDRFSRKMDKQISRNEKRRKNILEARTKNRQKIANKYDRKIGKLKAKNASSDKIKELQAQKKDKIQDFDIGTKFVKAGTKRATDIVKQYKKARVSAFKDSAYKKSPEYEKAVKEYVDQRYVYGYNQSATMYTLLAAANTLDEVKKK